MAARKYAGPSLPNHKICPQCGEHLSLFKFNPRKKSPDGRCSYCKVCQNKVSLTWDLNNKERKRAAESEWYRNNKARRKATCTAWNEANREQKSATQSKWHKDNPDKNRANTSKRRALEKDAFVENVSVMVLMMRDGLCCYYCSVPLDFEWNPEEYQPDYATIEHKIPLMRGGEHSYNNCVLSCADCNNRKNTMTDSEFLEKKD